MKQLLKVWLVMGWSLNLFASENFNGDLFVAQDLLNNSLTSNSIAILRNNSTTQNEKAQIARDIIRGTAQTNQGGEFVAYFSPLVGYSVHPKSTVRLSLRRICDRINFAISQIFVDRNRLPFLNYDFEKPIAEKDLEFIWGVIYMYFRERLPLHFYRLHSINFQRLVEAYKD